MDGGEKEGGEMADVRARRALSLFMLPVYRCEKRGGWKN